jgi:hypothetical protein
MAAAFKVADPTPDAIETASRVSSGRVGDCANDDALEPFNDATLSMEGQSRSENSRVRGE